MARTRSSPAGVGTLAASSPRCMTMSRTSAPSRARSGTSGSNPATRSGSAVTGPTAARVRLPSLASRWTSSSTSASRIAAIHAAAPGAEVKATASKAPAAVSRMDAVERLRVGRRTPSVDDEADRRRPGRGEPRLEAVVAGAVVLHRDRPPLDALGDEEVGDLGRRLGLGDPVGHQPGGLEGAAGLGSAGDEPGLLERGQQLVAEPGGLGGLQPAAEPDAGRDHDDVGVQVDDLRASARAASARRCGTPCRATGRSTTSAPRRSSARAKSPARRWAVTSTREPASTGPRPLTGRHRSHSARTSTTPVD